MRIIALLITLFTLYSCKKNYSVDLINKKNNKNILRVSLKDSDKITVKDLSGNIEFYFIKKQGEFYVSDSKFPINNDSALWMSNIRNYHISKGNNRKGSDFTIKKTNNSYISSFIYWDEYTRNNIEYYYKNNYEITKIVINSDIYSVE
ncbi:hypothetical protein I6H88_12240 [Elizabethkingia bruuniana]|uniref:Uncharacterized protein n=1 Tax=Elizabethkingia bruuniana TaxID=1756149 RepID=A0A7T7UWB7_9FLAO|nr:hypothetical protein [Elizabethkingia bruuniana]KGO10096.1 hypothetical protein KS04_11080 [Elizabethkingia miricola]AQX83814.1 hypothetical protein AYC65_01710 [Elizabethkingia bruuniana]KUY22074.1 hypothetical protein ATB97_12485 [Elizabethkingia bruuniana]OPB62286.1 hypothetical protein BAY12_10225 [Elizabethkingia bruuniana]QQN57224.1 hypothetical protein I6H88_12240 [Elizabethkingia bruuniana]